VHSLETIAFQHNYEQSRSYGILTVADLMISRHAGNASTMSNKELIVVFGEYGHANNEISFQ